MQLCQQGDAFYAPQLHLFPKGHQIAEDSLYPWQGAALNAPQCQFYESTHGPSSTTCQIAIFLQGDVFYAP